MSFPDFTQVPWRAPVADEAAAAPEAPSTQTPEGIDIKGLYTAQDTAGLGTRMAALFADAGLEEPISEWRGVDAIPAPQRKRQGRPARGSA